MTPQMVVEIGREALTVTLLIAAPMLGYLGVKREWVGNKPTGAGNVSAPASTAGYR